METTEKSKAVAVNTVYKTNVYGMFKKLKGNREVNNLHVKRLRDSFYEEYLQSPIIVNENYEIIDGQHRFEAAQQAEVPIYFIVVYGYGLREVQKLNTNTFNWTKLDYLKAYCDMEYPEYLRFRNFMRRFPQFGIRSCEMLLTGKTSKQGPYRNDEPDKYKGYHSKSFEEGELDIPDFDKSVEKATKLLQVKPYYQHFNRMTFVGTMVKLFDNPNYDHERFLQKLENCPLRLEDCASKHQYIRLIEDIYNYKSKVKVNLRY